MMIEKVSAQNVFPTPRVANVDGEQRHASQRQQPKQLVQSENKQVFDHKKKQEIEDVVKSLNNFLKPSHSSLKFEYHEDLNEYYVTVVDDVTKEVIKEIPPKKLLDMYAAMTEYVGLMVDKKI